MNARTANAPEVLDQQGRPVALGSELGRGGEGVVYEVRSNDRVVAKIYHSALSDERAEKLRTMTAMRNDQLKKFSAWPSELLLRKSGDVVGFIMPKVAGYKDIHNLYSPKSRRSEFTRADWRFLIRAGCNISRAFASVHESGCVIGDVNHSSILAAQDATVKLVDCDSFQISANGNRFLCEVGIETFTPPELQGKPFKGIVRTPNHDNFGLAVLVFLILYMGRHPFAGRYLGNGEMPIPRAIAECRFAYGSRRNAVLMEQPPGTPPLEVASREVALLFERAFAKETVAARRPTAREWITGLEGLEKRLEQCSSNPAHWHVAGLTECPWCQMEGTTSIALFPLIVQHSPGTAFDIDVIWRQIVALGHPGAPPLTGHPALVSDIRPSSAAIAAKRKTARQIIVAGATAMIPILLAVTAPLSGEAKVLLLAAGVGLYAFLLRVGHTTDHKADFIRREREALSRWVTVSGEWGAKAGPGAFGAKRAELDRLRSDWGNIPNFRVRKLHELEVKKYDLQLEKFLDKFGIEKAGISGIGPGRKATLEAYGIDTAADVTEHNLDVVPGFGPKLTSNLLSWRRSLERNFRFDPDKGVDPRDTARVEQEILAERQRIERNIVMAAAQLRQIHAQILAARKHMKPQVDAAYRAYMQAAVDAKAVR